MQGIILKQVEVSVHICIKKKQCYCCCIEVKLKMVKKKKKKNSLRQKNKSTAKGCPASTFLQRWAIFTGDFLGIDIDILLRKYKTSKITSTSTMIDCMVIFVTFVDVVVPLVLHHFVKWDRPWLCVLGVSCIFYCFFYFYLLRFFGK